MQLLGGVGDGGLGAAGEVSADQGEHGGHAAALLGEGRGGGGVDGDAGVADAAGEHADCGGGVQAAEGAGADVRDPGEGPLGGEDDQALGGVRQQGVDLVGVGGVVDEEDHAPPGQGCAQGGAELVLARAGRGGQAEPLQEGAQGALGGEGLAAGRGEPDAQQAVGVVVGDLADEGLGEGGAAGSGAARDQQQPRAGGLGLAAGEGVETRARDVLAQLLQLTPPPDEIRHGSAPLPAFGVRA